MDPSAAAAVLEKSLDPKGRCTIADASEKSGLALRDAESGLHALVAKYRGHLSVTEQGELLFSFPTGFTQPWVVRGAFSRFFSAIGRGLLGVARFIVRAWIAIVLVGYALVFLAIIFGLASSRGDRDRGGNGFGAVALLFRVIFDAFFWMWHPFSPFYVAPSFGYRQRGFAGERVEPKEPFYQRVDRFFFGPPPVKVDPLETERKIVERIRQSKGRIGVTDVIRATGLPRDEADALMSKLMLDYEGNVDVTEEGAIVYSFPSLRKTAKEGADPLRDRASRAPLQPKQLPPLTGNTIGTNLAIVALNGFNLIMSIYALANGLTINVLQQMLAKVPSQRIVYDGLPIALGVVPLVF